jgi:DNA-binding transcriptional MerR regulator
MSKTATAWEYGRTDDKSQDAFRTISEVSEELDIPAHVLRFWESKFPQIKPMKRGGGRRYYRPQDVALLAGVRNLLYKDGLTIKGVQKVFREQGLRWVAERGVAETAAPPPAGGAEVAEFPSGQPADGAKEQIQSVIDRLTDLRDRLRAG